MIEMIEMTRSRLTFNTASGKESPAVRFDGELPINPYFGYEYTAEEPDLGMDYTGYLGDIIGMQSKNV